MDNHNLHYFRGSYVVAEMLSGFELTNHLTRTYDEYEFQAIGKFCGYVDIKYGVILPFLPVMDMWMEFMSMRLDCPSCIFNYDFAEEFTEFLSDRITTAYFLAYEE